MRVLASPVRQELIDALSRTGPSSLAELGAVLGRPADGLYYHVRLLQRAGLVYSAGSRMRNGRREDLFRSGAGQYRLEYGDASPRRAFAFNAIIASMMRLGIRDYRRALAGGNCRLSGSSRDLWALRTVGRLERRDVSLVNRRIRALTRSMKRNAPSGRLYAITVLLTPLDHRATVNGRRPRRKASR